ncbi:MAG: sulfatase-like hydrolase/transferase [Planctomycetia bacterium]|nr:sulfatase-like hydrolase/transferase [Planctomycetia bacterium]
MFKKIEKNELGKAVFAALLAPILFAFLCLNIHYGNILECSESTFLLVLYFFLAPLGLGSVLFLVQCPFFGGKYFNGINLAVFLFGWLVWIQANIFNWGFSVFNGSVVNWEVFRPFIFLEIFFQIIIALLVFLARSWFFRKAALVSTIVLTAQFASFFWIMVPWIMDYRAEEKELASWLKYETDMSDEFRFSKKKNIILLVIDSFPGFMGERIMNDHPEIAENLKDFTFYRNFRSYPGGTTVNVPAFLTGQILREEIGTTTEYFTWSNYPKFIRSAFNSPLSVPKALKKQNCRVELYPEVRGVIHWDDQMIDNAVPCTSQRKVLYQDGSGMNDSCLNRVMDAAVFRICPTFLKKYASSIKKYLFWNAEQTFCPFVPEDVPACFPDRNINDPDTRFTQRMQSKIPFDLREEPCFKYIHLFGVHVPHQRDAHVLDKVPYDPENKNACAELTLELGYLRLAGQVIQKLKDQKLYDDATIIVMGDHAQHYSMVVPSAQNYYPTFDPDHTFFNNPLFLVKKSGDHSDRMRIREEIIRMDDIAPFLIQCAGGDLPAGTHTFEDLPESVLKERREQYDQTRQTARDDLAKLIDTVKLRKEKGAILPNKTSRSGRSWFLFKNEDFSELVLFGDRDRDYSRSFFLRSESAPGSSSEKDQYGFDFKPAVPFKKGDYDSNYMFIKAVFDRDVWCYACLLDLSEVPDGKYRMGILETTAGKDLCRETLFDVLTVKNGKIL